MFLKALTIKGFKSFADPAALEFEPGVTVVVGPNGSGKSNIVDAVAWVLGAQSPSALRSARMDDVVFAGSADRPALGRAEVQLTVDNSAGILPIGLSEVTITRTLFRSSGESEYRLNGAPCRLLDIQELLSDSGVGRTQHVIVSQGQLDTVLNARPEERRTVIEEAAGILKYRRRKQKAERRLEATEGNLQRLQDLLREVGRQRRPLERQADAAQRHGQVSADLYALRLHLAGRELAGLEARLGAAEGARKSTAEEETAVKALLLRLDDSVGAAETALDQLGGGELGALVARFEALRERARGLAAVIAERRRSLDRDRAAAVDASLVAALEAESVRVAEELAVVDSTAAELVPEVERLAEVEAGLTAERAQLEPPPGNARLVHEAAETRGELSGLRTAHERTEAELVRSRERLGELEGRVADLGASADRLRTEIEEHGAAAPSLAAALQAAHSEHSRREASLREAERRHRDAQASQQAWEARLEALTLALDEARTDATASRLGSLGGIVGPLHSLIEVDPGWEAAFEAAAEGAVGAAVVTDVAAARQALARLAESDTPGNVLALGASAPSPGSGRPAGVGEPVADHVRSRQPGVQALLDRLLASAVAVTGDWRAALDLALAHPDLVVVTLAGDRLGPTGWRIAAGAAKPSHLAHESARLRTAEAVKATEEAAALLEAATAGLAAADEALRAPSTASAANQAAVRAATDDLARVDAERRQLADTAAALRASVDEIAERLGREAARMAELEQRLPSQEADELAHGERLARADSLRAELDRRSSALAALRTDLQVRAGALEARRAELSRRLADIDSRLARYSLERQEAATRREKAQLACDRVDRLAGLVGRRAELLESRLDGLRTRARRQSEEARAAVVALDILRAERVTAGRRLEAVRESARRAELDEAEARLRLETARDALRRELDAEPGTAIKAVCPELPEGTSARTRVTELERELRLMGPINPLAVSEFAALSERHDFLETQLGDVRASRRELGKVIRAVDAEIAQIFTAAWADVAENFSALFQTLFPGGQGRLRLTDPDRPLETGIEIEARPSGKNVRRLTLLSGGERSLTALAFLFAVFRSRPSPFYLLDEVEAALDDVNLHRFLDLLGEFRKEAQLVVVSHQKRTMEAADCLYGVTMAPGQSSRVVSERVRAEL